MQEVLMFLKHIAVGIVVFLASLIPSAYVHTEPAQDRPIGSSESRPDLASASATSSIHQALFPIARNTEPAQKDSSSEGKSVKASTAASAFDTSNATGSAPASATSPVTLLPQSVVNDIARAAVVNILCTTKSGGYLNPISGSGVIITKNGVILTNAHVGQYFLLHDYPVPDNITCSIRTGSPAQATYLAELLYLPPAWVRANASQIVAQEAMGTGQDDYAFLRITSPINPSASLPETFPAISMTTDDPSRGEAVLLASYPASFLSGVVIQMNLYISSALTQIQDIFAFDERGNADLMSLGGSLVAQAGSSGGAVVRQQDGALQGIIATETQATSTSRVTSTATHNLYAITLGHINRSLQTAGIGGLVQLLSGDLQAKAADFMTTVAPGERQTLVDVLNKK